MLVMAMVLMQDGSTPLHSAARYGLSHVVECLVSRGADVEAADKVGVSCGQGCVVDDDDDDDTVLVVLLFVHLTCCGGPGQGVVPLH